MRRRAILAGGALATARFPASHAQGTRRRARVGYLSGAAALTDTGRLAALRAGLAELGHVEPETLELLVRFADGQDDRLTQAARALTAAAPDVIVVSGTRAVRVLMGETTAIPIVIASATDVVGAGLVASLARPGGNVTGLTMQRFDAVPKEVELLGELVPGLRRIAVLRGPAGGAGAELFEAVRMAAASRGIEARDHQVAEPHEIDAAFATIGEEGAQAVLLVDGPLLLVQRDRIAAAAQARRLPTLASSRDYVDAGALMAFGGNADARWRRAAWFVDRILRGAKPADLPVEQPTTFELVLNLRTARAIGLTVPQPLLLRADEVIE